MSTVRETLEYDASQAEAVLRALAARAHEAANAQRTAEEAAKDQQGALQRLSSVLSRAKDELDGVTAAQRQLKDAQDQANALFLQQAISAEEYSQALQILDRRMAQASSASGTMHDGAKRLEEGAGAAGSALGRLAGAASLVSPGLGEAARTAADLADVVEVGGQATAAAGVSLGTLAMVLGPVIVAVGLLGLGMEAAAEREEAAAKRAEEYARALEGVRAALGRVADAQGDVDLRAGMLTGEYSTTDAREAQARQAASGLTQAERDKASEELSQLLARQNVIRAQESGAGVGVMEGIKNLFVGPSASELGTEAHQVSARIAELEGTLKTLDQQEAHLVTTTVAVTEAEEKAKDSATHRAAASKAAAQVEDAAARALEGRAEAVRRATASYQEAQDPLLAYQRRLEEIGALEAAGKLSVQEAADARYVAAAQATAGVRARGGAGNAADQAAEQARADRAAEDAAAKAAAGAASRLAVTQTVAGLGGQLVQGDVVGMLSGALSLAGPYGAVAGGALSGISTLGQQGADGIATQIKDGLGSLTQGLEELPDLIGQLPEIVASSLPDFVSALIEASPMLAIELAKAQAETLLELPELIGAAVADALRDFVETGKDRLNPFSANENSFGERLQNFAVDAGRVLAGIGTLGSSEVLLRMADGATGGKVTETLYAGTREQGGANRRERTSRASGRAVLHIDRADRSAELRKVLPADDNGLTTALANNIRQADVRLPGRADSWRNET